MLLFILISACSGPVAPYYNVPLMSNTIHTMARPNNNLSVHVSDKFENPQLVGGHDIHRNVNFQEIIPWLKNRLHHIKALDCTLTKKTDITISVKKLYSTVDSETLVGVLVLKAKIVTTHGQTILRHYRGDCEMGFFALRKDEGLRACLNSALDSIIPRMKRDICEIGK